jgi:phosphoenolpyruvate synthase/pyruvate phosphate dikinase
LSHYRISLLKAKDGISGRLYIVQARPETVRSRVQQGSLKQTSVKDCGKVVLEGTAIGSDAAFGKVRVIEDLADISTMQQGDILVADITDRKYMQEMVTSCRHVPSFSQLADYFLFIITDLA